MSPADFRIVVPLITVRIRSSAVVSFFHSAAANSSMSSKSSSSTVNGVISSTVTVSSGSSSSVGNSSGPSGDGGSSVIQYATHRTHIYLTGSNMWGSIVYVEGVQDTESGDEVRRSDCAAESNLLVDLRYCLA